MPDYKTLEVKYDSGRLSVLLWYHDGNCETYDTVCAILLTGLSSLTVEKKLEQAEKLCTVCGPGSVVAK